MGCISSKPSIHQQVIIPSNTKHTIDDVLKLIPPKHDDTFNLKVANASEQYSKFHTVEEYDELVKRITDHNHNHAELAPAPDTTDNGSNIDHMQFQTVASLRQWLNAPGGADAATAECTGQKVGFSFYENNNSQGADEKTGRQEEGESIVELVAAFDKYMQQLQIDEDNFLKQIHNMIN